MSSRRLLLLLKHIPDESAFARYALRGGRMPRWQKAIEEIFNEQLRLRASYEAVSSRGEVHWDPADFAMIDPIDERERYKLAIDEAADDDRATEDFYADLGFS